jgi:hypothetical protein
MGRDGNANVEQCDEADDGDGEPWWNSKLA